MVTSAQDQAILYIFVILPRLADEPYETYRKRRVSILITYVAVARLEFPASKVVIGLGFDHPSKSYQGGSEDLIAFEKTGELSEAQAQDIRRAQVELKILSNRQEMRVWHADEFPGVGTNRQGTKFEAKREKRQKARDRKRSENRIRLTVKYSRRRNRRKK